MPLYNPQSILPPQAFLSEGLMKEIFKRYDKNGDGKLNKKELAEAFKNMGAFIPAWRAHCAMAHADSDSNGVITPDEFQHVIIYANKLGYTVWNDT
ncbi:hypothetical protein FNV43_RR11848 [Rhamnella rubrinervis]|uniref:EF-hand domain-containing protein n=1 Tax=Rhamnella rubrinervis TaxID=2594499 RepID=A0A8K0H770_9ROSA|nr:hypothetical protein FNV43_RR11848 [Rhamnella rubrinervis]